MCPESAARIVLHAVATGIIMWVCPLLLYYTLIITESMSVKV